MNKLKTKLRLTSIIALIAITVLSCKKDDEPVVPDPKASFTHVTDGKTVTFTNTSTDGDTYAWDFGDGQTSTSESPSNTYAANGSYIVTLTATNASGSNVYEAVIEIINITIDGDLSEWATVPAINATGGGTVTTIKLENLGNSKLFVYVEGTAEITNLAQVMLNTDNDRTTGALIDWIYFEAGEDVMIEGALPANAEQYGSIYHCSVCDGSAPGGWNWADPAYDDVISNFIVASDWVTVGNGVAYEFVIDLTALGVPINETSIGFGYVDVSLATWGPVGALPDLYNVDTNPTGTTYDYTFN